MPGGRVVRALALAAAVALLAPRAAHAKGCHEISDVVGLERCTRFGMWSRDADVPRLWIELGYFHEHFQSEPLALDASSRASSPQPLDLGTGAYGATVRALLGLGDAFYTGIELLPGAAIDEPTASGLTPMAGATFAMHGIAGVHVERYRVALSGELASGFRVAQLAYCVPDTDCKGTSFYGDTQTRLELQARVRADLYFHPNLSLSVGYGRSLVDRDDRIFMVGAAFHIRAMDGMW